METRRSNDPTSTETEDLQSIRGMASRNASALDAFYERHNRLAFSLILKIVGNRADAEDVLVDTFWQVWQQASRYEPSRGKPVAWLLTIARTRAIDSLRSSQRLGARTEEFDAPGSAPQAAVPAVDVVTIGIQSAVQQALGQLSDPQRKVLELAYFEGMSHSEIAAKTGQPLGTVKDRIRTGMVHLKKVLQPYL